MASSQRTRQEVQDEIDCYQVLLTSLAEIDVLTVDQEEEKEQYQAILTQLLQEMQNMDQSQSTVWRPNDQLPKREFKVEMDGASDYLRPPIRDSSYASLKRSRANYENDGMSTQRHGKSRRTTPEGSGEYSSAASIGSNFFDDELGLISDDEIKRDIEETARRHRQLEEDIKFAQQLADSFEQDDSYRATPMNNKSNKINVKSEKPSAYSQATFQPDGSFSVPPQSSVSSEQPFGSGINSEPHNESLWPGNHVSNGIDDELEIVDANGWLASMSSRMPIRSSYPSSFNTTMGRMPGAFPGGVKQEFSSLPYHSVYGSSSWTSTIGNATSWITPAATPLGTVGNPYTIDQLESMSSLRDTGFGSLYYSADSAQTQEEIKQLLANIRPDEEMTASELAIQPQGLRVKLMPHQIKGLAWMTKMETGSNKGGILADDMGLGKTIQAIAIMLTRPPPDHAKRPTLVVAPVALIDQWKRELTKLVSNNRRFTIYIHHGTAARSAQWEDIKHFDVIMTTYGTLGQELKRALRVQAKLKADPNASIGKREEATILGDSSVFYRVILDEAQHIKNRHTQNAKAVCRLRAEHRWCLSGTPMQNNVEEVFSYIQFCRIRPYCVWEKFSMDIARPAKSRYGPARASSLEKLQALLKAILLRRTKKSKIDGRPILQLPEKRIIEERAIFSEDQYKFYKALEERTQIEFNRYVKAGTVGRNYSHALVLLLRLRQCCCSPQLVVNSADFVTDGGIEGLDLIDNARKLPEAVVRRLKEQDDQECPICMDAVDNMMIFSTCGHMVCTEDFAKLVDSVGQDGTSDVKCPHCRAKIDTKSITDQISFKQVYLDAEGTPPKDAESDSDSDTYSDDDSESETYSNDGSDDGEDLRDFIVNDDVPVKTQGTDDENDDDLDIPQANKKLYTAPGIRRPPDYRPPGIRGKDSVKNEDDSDDMRIDLSVSNANKLKGKRKKQGGKRREKKKKEKKPHKSLADLRKDGMKNRAAKIRYLKQLSKIYEPCAKIDRTLGLLADIRENDASEKTIIFSSFTSFLDLLEVPLSRDPILNNYTRYDGSMTAKERNAAVLRFTDDPNCKTILVSLKAGNAGLNLTVANHVIILDPFWNPFVEHQAADRCHRIGQRREVTVHRILIGEEGHDYEEEDARRKRNADDPELKDNFHLFTVEDRILALQEKKRKLVESALDEEGSANVGRLGVRELGYLFGLNVMPRQAGS